MGYEFLGSVIVGYGILFSGVLKVWDFILKLKDKEIDHLLNQFNEKIVHENLNILINKKQDKSLRIEHINELREILDIPVEIDSLRKDARRNGLWSFIFLIVSGISVTISPFMPDLKSVNLSYDVVPFLFTVTFFIWFINYCIYLYGLKNEVLKAKKMIQNKKVIN